MTIGRKEIRTTVSKLTNFTEKQTHEFLSALEKNALAALMSGHKVSICNLGTMKIKEHAARVFKSPTTGVVHHLPAKKYISFVPSEKVIQRINIAAKKTK